LRRRPRGPLPLRSQRRVPITTALAPSDVVYSSRLGATILHVVARRARGLDASRSWITTLRSCANARRALPKGRRARIVRPRRLAVFADSEGAPLDRYVVFRAVRAAAKRAAVPWAGLHTLQHTCASILFRRGLNPKQVQASLGHHAASFTLDTYIHLLDDDLPDPGFFDEILGGHVRAARATETGRERQACSRERKGRLSSENSRRVSGRLEARASLKSGVPTGGVRVRVPSPAW
jgi:Phage integrase family